MHRRLKHAFIAAAVVGVATTALVSTMRGNGDAATSGKFRTEIVDQCGRVVLDDNGDPVILEITGVLIPADMRLRAEVRC